jgi:proline dehydrogenase
MSSVPFYARRFVSGTEMSEALEVTARLNSDKISATVDLLGENITEKSQATAFTEEYVLMLQKLQEKKLDAHVSVKLTMLGLDIDEEFCYQNLSKILKCADETNNRVAFDMEGTAYTERTLSMYERAAKEFRSAEIVLQAYLHRTTTDIERVLKANGRLRLCKGAYKESEKDALQKMPDIVANFKKLVTTLLERGQRVCIASHDDEIIDFCIALIAEKKIPRERYEFQMLYGMREKTWNKICAQGHQMTIYVPYGKHWQAYFSRRLAERKENIFFVVKNFFKD